MREHYRGAVYVPNLVSMEDKDNVLFEGQVLRKVDNVAELMKSFKSRVIGFHDLVFDMMMNSKGVVHVDGRDRVNLIVEEDGMVKNKLTFRTIHVHKENDCSDESFEVLKVSAIYERRQQLLY